MIDWQIITNRLRKHGSLESIGRENNISSVHLRRLARGEVKEPKFEAGIKLLDLHLDLFPDKHRDIKL